MSNDPGGPAAEANLAVGDVITGIDGASSQMSELSDARQRPRLLPAGTVVRFEVTRGADQKTFDVTLRDLIPPTA